MTGQFIRVIRNLNEILINVNLIWKIEVFYEADGHKVTGAAATQKADVARFFRIFVATESYDVRQDPDNPALEIIEEIYQSAIQKR